MNSAVQIQSDRQILPATPVEHSTVPVVLTAQTLLQGRSDITNTLRHASFDLRYVATWNRLPEAIDSIQANVVLVDIDAANLMYNGVQNVSGYRLVTLLARQLAQRPIALVIMTKLDFAEIEELARAGVHAIVSPEISAHAFVEQVRLALQCARKRHGLLNGYLTTEDASRHDDPVPVQEEPRSLEEDDGWRLPDLIWQRIEELLPPVRHPERTRSTDRRALDAVFFVLRSGSPWSKLPKSFGCATTARERVHEWVACGIMEEILAAGLDAHGGWEHLHWDRLTPVFPLTIARLAKTKTTMADMAVEIPCASETATKTGTRAKVAQVDEAALKRRVETTATTWSA